MPEPAEVAFYLPEADDMPEGWSVEFLWVESLGGDRYRVLTLPSFVEAAAVNDVISAKTPGPELAFESVIERSGHSMLQVLLEDSEGDSDDLMRPLQGFGCVFHLTHDGSSTYSVDVPESADVVGVIQYLNDRKTQGVRDWRWRVLAEAHDRALRSG